MKKSIFLMCLIFCSRLLAQPCNMQGTYSVGTGGQYTNLTSALTAIKTNGVSGPVIFELKAGYSGTGDTYPFTFNAIPCLSTTNNLTVRPAIDALALTLTSSASTVINLAGATNVVIDGRPGGLGIISQLTLSNTNATGSAVSFTNGAQNNQLQYLTLKAVSGETNGVLIFGTSTTVGNSFNIINNCTLGNGTTTPANGIYSEGSTGRKNSNNSVIDCNITNYYKSNSTVCGILLKNNSSDWTIMGNSFYHTTQYEFLYVSCNAISIKDTTSSGFIIHNNFVGGNAPQCAGTKINYRDKYAAIKLYVGKNGITSVQNNTITNIKFTSTSSTYSYFAGIELGNGKIHCGNIAGNIIGSQTENGAIQTFSILYDDSPIVGILAGRLGFEVYSYLDTLLIQNNKIGGITVRYSSPGSDYIGSPMYGIYIREQKSGFIDVGNNTIGSPTVPGSLDAVYGYHANVYGIYNNSGDNNTSYPAENKIHHNNIINCIGACTGIYINGGKPTVNNNSISKLYTNGANGLAGINLEKCSSGTVIKDNLLHSFIIRSTEAGTVYGITVNFAKGYSIERNFIHTFQRNTPYNGGDHVGIQSYGGNSLILNNMVRLGIDTTGASFSTAALKTIGMRVILDSSFIGHNSVYLGGSNLGTSYALEIIGSSSKFKEITNNILVNNRSCSTAVQCINAAIVFDINIDTNSLIVDHNIYYSNVPNMYLGNWKSVKYNTIEAWRNATKFDKHSMFYDPNFKNPEGNVNNVDLHLKNPTPAEGTGLLVPWIAEDIDGDVRSANSPVDIGADAGNYVLQDGDAPVIKHDAFLGHRIGTPSFYDARITDNGAGIDTAGNNKPRLWFRKKYPSVGNWYSTAGSLVNGNLFEGNWRFMLDPVTTGLPVNSGDSLEYYFVAQDKGPDVHISYSNLPGANHTSVNSQVTAPTSPLRLLVYGTLSDTIYVGVGQQFTSLSGDGGFFEACKSNLFSENTLSASVYIISDLQETGVHSLSLIDQPNLRLNILTNTPILKQVRQSNIYKRVIDLYNSPNITIDGSVNGSGRYLLFSNAHSVSANCYSTLSAQGKIGALTLNACIFESNSGSSFQPTVEINGNSAGKVRVTNNLFREVTSGPAGLPKVCLVTGASNITDSFIIRNNEFTNFGQTGLKASINSNEPSVLRLFIDSNHFYYTTTYDQIGERTALDASTGNNRISITNNYIGGTAKFCEGAPWTGRNGVTGIQVTASNNQPTSVQANIIQNIHIIESGRNFTGISLLQGIVHVGTLNGNTIGHPANDSSIVTKNVVTGIYGYVNIYSAYTPTDKIENTTISGCVAASFYGMNFQGRYAVIRNNKVFRNTSNAGDFIGMKIWIDSGSIEANWIYDLKNISSFATSNMGMDVLQKLAVPRFIYIGRNRIYRLISKQPSGAYLVGIRTGAGAYQVDNNQLNIDDIGGTGNFALYGWYSYDFTSTYSVTRARYNTIRIAGSTTAVKPSYAVYIEGGSPIVSFKNNLLYNERTSGSTKNLALAMNATSTNPPVWTGNANNNLFVTADTASVNEWKGTVTNIFNWRSLSGGDNASYSAMKTQLISSAFFQNLSEGDLNINSSSPLSWYVNGKGSPVSDISGDFDSSSHVRSVSLSAGPTDIGADEFNTTTQPPSLYVYGRHQPGGADTIAWNGRIMAVITWGNVGTLPALGDVKWYSGTWPVDTVRNDTGWISSYLYIPATGGSGYTYDIRMMYDSSMLGKITRESAMQIFKRPSGTGNWAPLPSSVDVAKKIIIATGLTSFSDFSAAEELLFRWTGTVSASWTNPANWSKNLVPSVQDDIKIEAGTAFNPAVPAGIIVRCRSLVLGTGVVVTLNINSNIIVGE